MRFLRWFTFSTRVTILFLVAAAAGMGAGYQHRDVSFWLFFFSVFCFTILLLMRADD